MYSVEHHHEGRYAAKVLTLADPFNDSRNKNHPLLCVGQNNHIWNRRDPYALTISHGKGPFSRAFLGCRRKLS